ncbi:hypothetical protein ACFPM7_29690 [Actinokineospora guangxiensis]|uniref:Uncharacterized protein n=1 Tax=Actinokineospora guangxiensis TaxID=1490288 RepID=A0ABW0EVY9_9PSEU
MVLATGGATIEVVGADFDGTASAFLDQVLRSRGDDPRGVDGSRGTVTTAAGLVGVAQNSTSSRGDGLDVAFKTGVGAQAVAAPALLVSVRTSPGQFERRHDEVAAFPRSVAPGGNR